MLEASDVKGLLKLPFSMYLGIILSNKELSAKLLSFGGWRRCDLPYTSTCIDILAFVSIPTKSMSPVQLGLDQCLRLRRSPAPDSDTCKSPSSGPFLLAFS